MTNHIVVARPGYDIAGGETSSLLRDRIIDLRKLGNDAQRILRQVSGERVFITDVVMNVISATEIRRLAKEDRFEDLNTLVPQPVAEYITKYRIYRDSHEA
jgi:nicotinic acid mononucleotide adenylyltransferase